MTTDVKGTRLPADICLSVLAIYKEKISLKSNVGPTAYPD